MQQELATELLAELTGLILGSEALADQEWSSLALVVIRDGGWSVSGIWYGDGEDDVTPFLPDEEFDDLIRDFYDATLVAGAAGWLSCLFQIKRADMRMQVRFEYDDPDRWAVTPYNRATLTAALRE